MKSFGVYSILSLVACLLLLQLQTASAQILKGGQVGLTLTCNIANLAADGACDEFIAPVLDPVNEFLSPVTEPIADFVSPVTEPIGNFFQDVGNGIAGWFRSDDMLVSRLATDDLAVTELAILAAENDPLALKAILVERQEAEAQAAQAKKAEALRILCETFPSAC